MNRKAKVCVKGAPTVLAILLLVGCNGMGNAPNSGGNGKLSFAGCYAPNANTGNVDCGLSSSLGDPNSDATFQAEVNFQQNFWNGIAANVHPWNDCSGANALSLPSGDILYGVTLFHQLVGSYGGDAAPISGVLAHEWGHQVQFDNGWFTSSETSNRPIELEADAFSGFYMALGKSYSWGSIDNYFSAVTSFGDYDFNSPSHHGTPPERLAAAQLGFQTATQAMQTGTQLTYADLHQIFSSAITGFSEKRVPALNSQSQIASEFLARLNISQIIDILKGVTHGEDVAVPTIEHSERLYPKKQRD